MKYFFADIRSTYIWVCTQMLTQVKSRCLKKIISQGTV